MEKNKKKVQDKKEYSPEDFVKKYKELCEEYGYRIVVTPVWKVSQDVGDWRLVLQTSVGRLPGR